MTPKQLKAENEKLRALLAEVRDILYRQSKDPGSYAPRNFDEKQVLAIAEHHGYGNLMVLLSARWYERQRGGAFSVGECISTNAALVRKIDAALATPGTPEARGRG